MQTTMKRGISSDPFQCKPEIAFFKVIFLFQMTYLGVLYERLYIESSKSAVLRANNIKAARKMLQMIFVVIFTFYSFSQKRLCQWNVRKCSIKKGFNENGSLSIS